MQQNCETTNHLYLTYISMERSILLKIEKSEKPEKPEKCSFEI
jgi:hypothetical protein